MKTLTKILTVVALVVLCVALFTVTAFAAQGDIKNTSPQVNATCTEAGKRAVIEVENSSGGSEFWCLSKDEALPASPINWPPSTNYPGWANVTSLDAGIAIPATGHPTASFTGPYGGTDPTCTAPGMKLYYTCSEPCCAGKFFTAAGTEIPAASVYIDPTPDDDDAHDWQPDPSRSKEPTDVSPGWTFYYCSYNPKHTKMEEIEAKGITAADGGVDIGYVIPINNTWQPGQEGLTFESSLVAALNAASGPNANYVGVRVGQYSLYENSWDTFDFWSWDEYVKLGDKTMASLEPGKYQIWIYDKRHPDQFTASLPFWVLDVPTLEPYSTDKHVVNSSKSLRFVASEEIDPSTVKVGSRKLYDANDFFVSNDRQNITLSPDFLNARQTGTYTISAKTKGGQTIKTNFYILSTAQASSSPRTGDESQIGLWAAFLLLSGAAIVVMVPKLRKNGVK